MLSTIFLLFIVFVVSLPRSQQLLSTSSRWIVDAKSGRRVKLACVNWPAHMHAMVAEGLHKKPLNNLTADIASMGFNCVRLTWATYMFTREGKAKLTVAESLDRWNLTEAKEGVAKNNPEILGLGLIEAQKAVIDGIGAKDLMVVLDNHVSLAQWCCSENDGNGFFGDEYFDPKEWLQGLSMVAKRYKGDPTVVGMSMRNELRGNRQNDDDWYTYIEKGADAIHIANPDVLVIVSGLSFETDLTFLKKRPLRLNLYKKLVYEAHWYAFGDPPEKWVYQTNEFCQSITQWFMSQSGFVLGGSDPVPLFLSEFGKEQSGRKEAENRYFSCLMAFVAEKDMDWALWGLQGSYMLREGHVEMEEPYGMLDANWGSLRNSTILQRLQLIFKMIQDPKSNDPTYKMMYHPQSGQCINTNTKDNNISATDCQKWSQWSHDEDGSPIQLKGRSRCLTAVGDGLPAVVSDDCTSQRSMWKYVSSSKLHLAAKDDQGRDLCLDWNSSTTTIVTNKCLCVGDDLEDVSWCNEDPTRQWFKLIPAN